MCCGCVFLLFHSAGGALWAAYLGTLHCKRHVQHVSKGTVVAQVKAQCEAAGKCDMGGFTRLLHSGQPDELMEEIPTFVANPLPDEGHKGSAPT